MDSPRRNLGKKGDYRGLLGRHIAYSLVNPYHCSDMPLSEESDPFGKQQKQPCTGATTAAEKAGTTDAQRAAAPAFFFLPVLPGRSHCTACSSQRPPRTTCSGQHPAARPAAYHASAARLPYASIQQTAAPYCTACTLPALKQPAPPAALPRLPDDAAPGLLWGGSLAR